jgi:hypothetical protein
MGIAAQMSIREGRAVSMEETGLMPARLRAA